MSRLRAIFIGTAGGIALAAGLTAAMDARGFECCDPWGVPATNAFVAAGSSVVRAITAAVTLVVNEVEIGPLNSWSQGVGKATGEFSKKTASARTMEQGAIEADYAMHVQSKVGDAALDKVEPAMLDQTIANTAILAEGQSAEGRLLRQYGSQFQNTAMVPAYADPLTLAKRHWQKYCDAQDKDRGLCTGVFNADLDNQGADVRVETLYGMASYSTATRDAALAFVDMVVAPEPLRAQTLPAGTAPNPMVEAYTLSDQAALGLAANSLLAHIAERTPKQADP